MRKTVSLSALLRSAGDGAAAAAGNSAPPIRKDSPMITAGSRKNSEAIRLLDSALGADKHLAPPDPVGLADDALVFHVFDDSGSSVVANLQVPLDKTG